MEKVDIDSGRMIDKCDSFSSKTEDELEWTNNNKLFPKMKKKDFYLAAKSQQHIQFSI